MLIFQMSCLSGEARGQIDMWEHEVYYFCQLDKEVVHAGHYISPLTTNYSALLHE